MLAGLALNDVIAPHALYDVRLVQFAMRDAFLDHPPLLVKILLCELVFPNILQKLQDVDLQYLPIDSPYL